MPRISTDNYDTVASWNGSQDLFIVEQPDGTKVATPAMVKQFIEAGDFEATGEVKDGHGNILKNMAKSADVDAAISGINDEIDGINTDLTEAIKHTLKYVDPATIDADVLSRGGVVNNAGSYFSINKGRLGLGVCADAGDNNKYLIALLYRASSADTVKYVELAKNGLYISGANAFGTAAISGNTGTRLAYTIVFY